MITVAVVAIIATVAYPSYQGFITKTVRSQAKSQLTQVATRQEQFFLDNKAYAADLTDLGYTANPYYVNRDGVVVASGSTDRVYKIGIASVTATAYVAEAVPLGHQASRDTSCGTLRIANTGERSHTGTGDDCW
jgi:type IV pilus assembly protein PilE